MRNAGLERVGAPRQGACQLPQARPGCATNCSNKGDVVQSCSVDQRPWQNGSALWQMRQSARAVRHWRRTRPLRDGMGVKRVTLRCRPLIAPSRARNIHTSERSISGRWLLERSRSRHYPSARKSMPLVSGSCQASSAVSEATTQPKAKNCGAGPPTAAEARG